MDDLGGAGSGGAGDDFAAGDLVDQGRGELGAAGVGDADEEHLRDGVVAVSGDVCESLPGEAFGERTSAPVTFAVRASDV